MKKLLCFLLLLILVGCNKGYDSLEEAVQSQWNSPIEILNQNKDKQLVYYWDQTQYILGVYHYEKGKYRYDNQQSIGIEIQSESGLPFLISANHFEGIGDIIQGAINTDKYEVDRFVIEYSNGKMQEVKATNNTFIVDYPLHLTVSSNEFFSDFKNAYGFDKNNEIIESWK